MTDDTGIYQHSLFSIPDRAHGYCIDDNARALMLMSVADDLSDSTRATLGRVYAAFVQDAWNADRGEFRNFMAFDRSWLEAVGSEDSNGRTVWSLGIAELRHPDPLLQRWAASLLDEVINALPEWTSPRAKAFAVLGLLAMAISRPNDTSTAARIRRLSDDILEGYRYNAANGLLWFEQVLSYDNARLSEAMLRAGAFLGDDAMVEAGATSLRWLAGRQTVEVDGDLLFQPVPTTAFGAPIPEAPSRRPAYDQQPVDAWATVDACLAAARVAPDPAWRPHARAALDWFDGANSAGVALAAHETGECGDGIVPGGANLNRGAESVLAYQFAARRADEVAALDTHG